MSPRLASQSAFPPTENVLWRWPFPPDAWERTPREVRDFFLVQTAGLQQLRAENLELQKAIAALTARLNKDSKNSSKPPSSDSPAQKARRKRDKQQAAEKTSPATPPKKRGARPGHPGHGPVLLEPTQPPIEVRPDCCTGCGGQHFSHFVHYDTRQHIEIRIERSVEHAHCFEGTCGVCGTVTRPALPQPFRTGFGPTATTLAAFLTGLFPGTRRAVRDFFQQVLEIPIDLGTVQKLIDRSSQAIEPLYDAIGGIARTAPVNHVDETSQFLHHQLVWLWVMANRSVAYYKIHKNRSAEAFRALIGDWAGTLVADDYVVYRDWPHDKQSCIPHLQRHATAAAESPDPEIGRFGKRMLEELSRLSAMAHAPPTMGQFLAWLMRISRLLNSHAERTDDAGTLARAIQRQKRDLWTFLVVPGVEPTNNRAERAVRFGVLWRKRSLSIQSEKGCRWVERLLTVRETSRLQGVPFYAVLRDAVRAHLEGARPDLAWLPAA